MCVCVCVCTYNTSTHIQVKDVQPAAEAAFDAILKTLSPHGLYAVLPVLGEGLTNRDSQWQSKVCLSQQ